MGGQSKTEVPVATGTEAFGGLKLSWLMAFLALAEAGKGSAAAADLGISPGALSKQIKSLEDWARVDLVQQVDRELALTDAGADFLPIADNIVSQLKAFRPPEWDRENGGHVFRNVTL